jgi:hypothetical protein
MGGGIAIIPSAWRRFNRRGPVALGKEPDEEQKKEKKKAPKKKR